MDFVESHYVRESVRKLLECIICDHDGLHSLHKEYSIDQILEDFTVVRESRIVYVWDVEVRVIHNTSMGYLQV
jgi:hypothetical protein